MSALKKNPGFTLIELMVTISVLAIGAALAYPSFSGVMRSNRLATSTNTLIASFNLARTEAIRSNRGGGVCPSPDGLACAGSDWNAGVLVFTDNDRSGSWSAGDTPLRYFDAHSRLVIEAELGAGEPGAGGGTAISEVAFDPRGRSSVATEVVLKPVDCKPGDQLQRRVHVTRFGQTRTSKESCE